MEGGKLPDVPLQVDQRRPNAWILIGVGCFAGFLSGLFGIGGGTIIVPALVLWMAFPQRLATGTSVAAILPTAVFGMVTYGLHGQVDWVAAGALAIGVFAGAQLGSYLLARIRVATLQWSFVAFLAVVIVSLWLVIPERGDVMSLGLVGAIVLVGVGLVTGTLGGILGVGVGIIVVPVLMFFFGASDVVAKGTSLAMMIPGSISGTIGNIRRSNTDLKAAAFLGLASCALVPVGAAVANAISPQAANIVFSFYLALIAGQMISRRRKAAREAAAVDR